MVGGSTDKDESEVAVIPNQSAPRWKVTTLTARGNCRKASRQATSVCWGAIRWALSTTRLDGTIAGVDEVVRALGGREEVDELADLSPCGLDVTGLSLSKEMFELGEDLLRSD